MLCPLGSIPPAYRLENHYFRLPCSGNGQCLSLRETSLLTKYNQTEYNNWDSDMIYGCVCDSGFHGSDCSMKYCTFGDDPLTQGQKEIQLIDCQCTSCDGGLYITFNGQKTAYIPYNSTFDLILYRLQVNTFQLIKTNDFLFVL